MEIWKTMKEHTDYEISNLGRIKNKKTGRIRKTTISNKGYKQIIVYINKKAKRFTRKYHKNMEKHYRNTKRNKF